MSGQSNLRHRRLRARRGVIMILFTMILLFIVLPAVGLAIDAGVMFVVKDKMQTATDGAALSAARSLSRGTDFSSQQTAASATARKYFHMNMENGFLGSMATGDPVVTFPAGSSQTMNVRVEAEVQAPTYFMRILGPTSVTLRSASQTMRRFVNIMMVIDRSGSLGSACPQLRAAATQFANAFVNGRDKLGLETFGTSYRTDFPIDDDFLSASTSVPDLISDIYCVGGTNSGAAYWQAYQQLLALNEPGALNVILFFTDGLPNTIHMPSLQIKSTSACSDKSALRNGVIAATTGSKAAGLFVGVQTHAPGSSISPDTTFISNSNDCSFRGNYTDLDDDLEGLTRTGQPEVDVFGTSITGWKSLTRDSSSRVAVTNANATNAGINVLVNAAENARNNTSLNVITYAVGLGSAVDENILERVANVPGSTFYNSNRPAGKYIYAADGNQLQSAFAQLASEVLRISH